ncbi:MAG: RNA 2',3'-cyclic phosphodiesterase [Candidatus Saelkia tenebricola]|nr:RNA 2',3'-cyclic phosphodiesterase [Candidatus Saelkia tenebricola]
MQTLRTFIAIELNKQTQFRISEIQNNFKNLNVYLKLVEPKNIHLTLHFLGNLDISKIDSLNKKIPVIMKNIESFKIRPQGIGAFPNIKNPHIIWIGIKEGATKLKDTQERVKNILNIIHIQTDSREFHPHLTIARVKSKENGHILTKSLTELEYFQFDEILIGEITLFKSTLTPKGPTYEILEKWKLGNP